jgi:hypothetical protein
VAGERRKFPPLSSTEPSPATRRDKEYKLELSKLIFAFGWKYSYQSKILKFNVSSALKMLFPLIFKSNMIKCNDSSAALV